MNTEKKVRVISKKIDKIMFLLVLISFGAVVASIYVFAKGSSIGASAGTATGKLVGSIEGLSNAKSAYEAGKTQGLSNEDTTVEIANIVKKVENLEVLVASVKLNDMHEIGDDYAALYLLKGDAVFTVDLSLTTFDENMEDIYITIPQPEVDLIIDQSEMEKVAEYQEHFFTGSSEDGYDDYINMMKEIAKKPAEKLANYDALMELAKTAAEKQVKALVEAMNLSDKQVYVGFQETEVTNETK